LSRQAKFFLKSITTLQSPPADTLYRLDEVHCVHNFEQPLLLWSVIAGLPAGPGRARPKLAAGRAGPQNGLEIAAGPSRKFSARAHLYRKPQLQNIMTYPIGRPRG